MRPDFHHLARLLLTALLIVLAPLSAQAATRIGIIMSGDIPYYRAMHESFVAELTQAFSGGEQVEIIVQRPFPDSIAWSNAARKLIAVEVDLIVTYGSPSTRAVVHEKSRIPHVYAGVYDPDKADITGKNVTGCGYRVPLSSLLRYFKRVREIKTLSVVYSGIEEDSVRQRDELQAIAGQQNIQVNQADIRSRSDTDKLESIQDDDAVFITGSALVHLWIEDLLAVLHAGNDPSADIFPDDNESGIMVTLYQPPEVQGKTAAEMAARILRGENPSDIAPVVLRENNLVFNLIEAQRIGITFPMQLIVEATRVIK